MTLMLLAHLKKNKVFATKLEKITKIWLETAIISLKKEALSADLGIMLFSKD
jgi:hypothetical protein